MKNNFVKSKNNAKKNGDFKIKIRHNRSSNENRNIIAKTPNIEFKTQLD